MFKDYLKIADKQYRVEANWNAIADFCRRKGVSDLSRLDILVNIAIDDILTLMYSCIREGERIEGRDFDMTEEDLGSVINTHAMGEFMKLYAAQSQAGVSSGGTKKK